MSTPSPNPLPSPGDRLARAAMAGLGLGLFFGGVALVVIGWRTFQTDPGCRTLSPNECAIQLETLLFLARRQAIFGGALMLLGLASFLLLRAQQRKAREAVEDRSA